MSGIGSMDFDDLGDFCKSYEGIGTEPRVLPGSILMARLDGRSFHNLTRNLDKPFSNPFSETMIETTRSLVREFTADFGYTQSDEISLVWTLKTPESQFPFGGKFHKLNSILAGYCSCRFNQLWNKGGNEEQPKFALFDCRTWPVPNEDIATKTIMWRQWDAERNSINMVAHHAFGSKKLEGIGTNERLKKLEEKGIIWGNYEDKFKSGTFIFPKVTQVKLTEAEIAKIPAPFRYSTGLVNRTDYHRFHVRLRSLNSDISATNYFFPKKE